jgi:hypothetical protein
LIVIAHLKSSKDKGKGRALSNLIDGLEDDIVPDPKASPGYDALVTSEGESDDGDSDFEASEPDYEDEDDRDISLRNNRKFLSQRTSRVDIRDVHEVEEAMVAAATEASIRDKSGGASTSAGSSGCNVSWRPMVASTPENHNVNLEVVPDSEPEDELMVTDPEDEPVVVQRGRISLGKGRGRNKGHRRTEFDADNMHDVFSARREARKGSRLEKQEIRMLEYQLGRRLTYVGQASNLYALISPF